MSRICLSMIVKNESAVIERCLKSVLPFVDAVCIVDTGSTDDTKEKIHATCRARVPVCRVYDSVWVDYATNRNEALEKAREFLRSSDPSDDAWKDDYIMVMDASDVLAQPGLAPHGSPSWQGHHLDGYMATYRMGDLVWNRPILIKASVPWAYHFPVHEVLMRRPDDAMDLPSSGLQVECNVGEGYKGPAHYLEHARILEAYLVEHPDCTRSQFYLGQSYHCAGQTDKAIKAYAHRTQMRGGWSEEAMIAWLRIGELSDDPGAYLEAAVLNTTRPEGLYGAAMWCKHHGLTTLAKAMALQAWQRTFINPEGLFVDSSVYRWKAKKLLAELTRDRRMAQEVIDTPGAEYGPELLSLV